MSFDVLLEDKEIISVLVRTCALPVGSSIRPAVGGRRFGVYVLADIRGGIEKPVAQIRLVDKV